MKYKTILFDLDGTLTDPKIGITLSVAYALEHFGIHVDDPDSLTKFIGPPLSDSFMEFYGFDSERANEAVAKYRERFSVTGLLENQVYPGVEEMLSVLRGEGKTLVIATSKPTVYTKRILEHFGLDKYFSFVSGSELDGSRVKKEDVVDYALEGSNGERPTSVMVGDRKFDIMGARHAGIASIGVTYGYGGLEELTEAGADMTVSTVDELLEALRG